MTEEVDPYRVTPETLKYWPPLLEHAFGQVVQFSSEPLFAVEGYVHDIGHALLHFGEVQRTQSLRILVKEELYGQNYCAAVKEEVLVLAAEKRLLQMLVEPYFAWDPQIVLSLHDSLVCVHGKAPACWDLERRISVTMATKRAAVLARRIDKTIRAAVAWAATTPLSSPAI